MIKFLHRLFVPNRIDVCVLVLAIHWLAVVACLFVLPSLLVFSGDFPYLFVIAIVGSSFVAIAAMNRWKSGASRRSWLLLVSGLLSWIATFLYMTFYWNSLHAAPLYAALYGYKTEASLSTFQTYWALYAAATLVACVVVWGLCSLCQLVGSKVGGSFSGIRNRFAADRTRLLIRFAAVMFVIAMFGRVLASFGVWESGVNVIFQIPIYIALAWIFVIWLPRSHAAVGKPWQKLCSFLIALALLVVPTVIASIVNIGISFGDVIGPAVAGAGYVLSVVALGSLDRHIKADDTVADQNASIKLPTLSALIPTLLLLAVVIGPWMLDVSKLIYQPPGVSLKQRFELAYEAARVSRLSGGRIVALANPQPQADSWRVTFDDDAPVDLLSLLPSGSSAGFELVNVTPKFDLSSIAQNGALVSIENSKVSVTQLSQLLSDGAMIQIKGKFDVVGEVELDKVVKPARIFFSKCPPETVTKFYEATKESVVADTIYLSDPVDQKDWQAVVSLSQKCGVNLNGGIAPNVNVTQFNLPLSNILLHAYSPNGIRTRVPQEILADTDIFLNLYSEIGGAPDLAVKLMFLRGSPLQFDLASRFVGRAVDYLRTFVTENKLAFQFSDDGSIEALYLPNSSGVKELGQLTELRVLAFNESWTSKVNLVRFGWFRMAVAPRDMSYLKKLTKLEELYFEDEFVPENTSFLKQLVSLKHLQIPRVERKVTGSIGFESCPALESITFLGRPDSQSIRELTQVKTLKKITIVNNEEEPELNEAVVEKIGERLAGVKVELLKKEQMSTLVPESFKAHREAVRKELRADLSWLDRLWD